MTAQPYPSPSWWRHACDLGFEPTLRHRRVRSGIAVREEQRWLVLSHRARPGADPLDDLGAPGPWRSLPAEPRVVGGRRRGATRVFELPPGVADFGEEGTPDEETALAALLGWARATSGGALPPDAPPFARDEVESWIDPTRRHVRAGSHVVPVEPIVEGARLGLAAPALVRLPDGLPTTRRAWVRAICLDARTRWRLVRFGLADADVRAEVDLSGAPLRSAPQLFEIALSALTTAAAWALPALALATDAHTQSRLLDHPPGRELPPGTQGGAA